jgi:hypothetical protein
MESQSHEKTGPDAGTLALCFPPGNRAKMQSQLQYEFERNRWASEQRTNWLAPSVEGKELFIGGSVCGIMVPGRAAGGSQDREGNGALKSPRSSSPDTGHSPKLASGTLVVWRSQDSRMEVRLPDSSGPRLVSLLRSSSPLALGEESVTVLTLGYKTSYNTQLC